MQWKVLFLSSVIFISSFVQAQLPAYPKGYFRNPLGIPIDLSANFGELRPNHWHMGLDLRTNQRENLPVYAAAEGYISHIGIRAQSFGRFITITHPNGLSTLYAHLNDFYPELEEYVTGQQYSQESWAIELDLEKNKFPVQKGQLIAYSGNTGGSQGPHLHFEIFDTKTTKRLNPLLFGFDVEDRVAPTIVKLAMYDRSKSVYDQSPRFFALKNTDSGYIIPKLPVIVTGLDRVSFAIQAYDRLSGSNNPNGIFSAKLFINYEPQLSFVLDSIDYKETRYMNAHIDYKYDYNGGAYLQHLSKLPGDNGAAYHVIKNDGIIHLTDTTIRNVSIDVKDAHGNTSQINFGIQYSDSLAQQIMKYRNPAQRFAPNMVSVLEKPDFELFIGESCLYDTVQSVYFRNNAVVTTIVSGIHQVNDGSFPVHDDLTVRIKPTKQIPVEWKDKLLIQKTSKGSTIRKAEWQGDWVTAKFGDFGTFQVVADVTPPQLNELGRGDTINLSAASRIVFSPTDNFGMVKKLRAELNGQWLRFTNDKTRNWIYIFDEKCPYGVHELKVTIEDLVGNTTTKIWWFKRLPYTPPPPKKKAVKKTSTKKKIIPKKKK